MTMIIVSVAFVICWFPATFYFVIFDASSHTSGLYVGYHFAVFLSYLYVCMNPFIYAFKHEAVKETLSRLMVCRKRVEATSVGDAPRNNYNTRNIAVRPTTAVA